MIFLRTKYVVFWIRGYKRAMVKSMTTAATIPHFHYIDEINCDKLGKLRDAFRKQNSDSDIKFTFLPMLIKSLSIALTKHRLLNSSFNLEKYEVTLKGFYSCSCLDLVSCSFSHLYSSFGNLFFFFCHNCRFSQHWIRNGYTSRFSSTKHKECSIAFNIRG